MRKILTIAGFDTSGGAGLQADIKTIHSLKAHPLSIVSSVTAQNSLGITKKFDTKPKSLKAQINAIKKDIKADAVKLGMLPNAKSIQIISNFLEDFRGSVVLDTPFISSSGYRLMDKRAVKCLKKRLIPKCTLITPNIPEAELLSGVKIKKLKDMKSVAKKIAKRFKIKAVLIKGGHLYSKKSIDVLCIDGKITIYKTKKLSEHSSYHGTGCTLSSAIATFLAKGNSLEKSVKKAKRYITKAIKKSYKVGKSETRYLLHKGDTCLT